MRSSIFALALVFGFASSAFAAPAREEIEQLLARVAALEEVKFVRNGTEHTAAQAVAHLRLKWERQAERIRTAEDFIAQCATKSSTSGSRYRLRSKDGNESDCATLLGGWLTEMRRTERPPR